MKILLYNPPRFRGIPVIREERCEITERYSVLQPYSLLQIGALLRETGHQVSLIDANGRNLDYTPKHFKGYDAVIFRFTPTTFDHDMKTAKYAKRKGAITIGLCFTLRSEAEKIMKEVPELDYYVRSDYEAVVPNLVNNLLNPESVEGITYRKGKRITSNKDNTQQGDFNILPAYDLLEDFSPYFINTKAGQPITIMYTSKGCPYRCTYCTVAGTKLKLKPAKTVLHEVKHLKKNFAIKTISFFDETFTIDTARVEEICKGLNGMNITWYCNTRANLLTPEMLKTMRSAGCKGLSLGVESGSDLILKNVSKGITAKQQEEAIRWCKKAGIKVYCSFIFGLPGETKETVQETIDFVKRTLPTSAQFNVAVPYPGTQLYSIARKKKWITKLNWRDLYQDESHMKTDALSPKQLDQARKDAYKALYFNPRWILQNIIHVIKNPSDFVLATRYFMKIMNNYLFKGMKHAH